MESLGGGVQCRSNDVGSVVIFDFRNVGAEAGSEGEVFRWAMVNDHWSFLGMMGW